MVQAPIDLTGEQLAIVKQQTGPLLVQAPVGSGKTLVLAVRAVEALEQGVPAGEMLALTFTNRAARQMRDRLTDLVGPPPPDLMVTTFHGLCVRILRRDGKELAIEPDFAIWDAVDRREAIRLAAEQCGYGASDKHLDWLVDTIVAHKSKGRLPQNAGTADGPEWPVYRAYQHLLETSRALDFDDLVVQTATLLDHSRAVRAAWAARCRWVEVDEFQDTSNLEYKVLRSLTRDYRSLCVFGDEQQAIYRWRGVDPGRLYQQFQSDHPVLARLSLSRHFRSTAPILAAARGIFLAAPPAVTGDSVRLVPCDDAQDEGQHIARRVAAVHDDGTPWSSIAVLARTHRTVMALAEALASHDVPVATAAAREFFRQPAVKDIAAYLRLIDDPRDVIALRRIAGYAPLGLPPATLSAIAAEGRACGLLLTDLIDAATLDDGDPCADALAVAGRDHVVLDLEATGLDPARDEPVEIGVVRVDGAIGQREERCWLVRPGRSVGASVQTHGHSDEYLATHGQPPAAVYAAVRAWVGRRALVGHNIDRYDEPLLRGAFERVGVPALRGRTIDTLWLARRTLTLDRYNLDRVRQACGVAATPNHRALADARCTADCFPVLVARLAATTASRRALVARWRDAFRPLAALLGDWLARADTLTVSTLLAQVVAASGLLVATEGRTPDQVRATARALEHLRALAAERFDPLPPAAGRRAFLDYIGTASNADGYAREEDRLLVLTLHAAKGLEFDTVFIAGTHDREFPSWRSTTPADRDEDRRVLYVGMTRARRHLEITYPARETTPWGKVQARAASPFLAHLASG
ncbi:MAG: UvrD-helicase domain-containing protein [Chloroflexi bacterium]|nr:UvrD-helicase domain-containing protein [Chloroflexota bacterium]